jgi:hypothetical protein
MFWENLTQDEQDRYYFLLNSTKPFLSWASLSKNQKAKVTPVERPLDEVWFEMDKLSRKGWQM